MKKELTYELDYKIFDQPLTPVGVDHKNIGGAKKSLYMISYTGLK